MPTRPPPYKIFSSYEVHKGQDVDWTIPEDPCHWDKDDQDRLLRNTMIKRQLQQGKGVQFCQGGDSLATRVQPGDCTLWEPTTTASVHKVGDVVFCEVQPKGYFYAHKICRIEDEGPHLKYFIGREEDDTVKVGWCHAEHIHGRLLEVLYCS